MNEQRRSIMQLVAAAVISGAVASTIIGAMFTGYVTQVEQDVRSLRAWKEESVAELLGPMNMQFMRTKRAFDRWNDKNLYIEAKVIRVGNQAIRDLLLENGHLIPPDLFEAAAELIEHYDVWLELFEKTRGGEEPDLQSSFVFAGPEGFGFPRSAEGQFRQKYQEYWNDLYGDR